MTVLFVSNKPYEKVAALKLFKPYCDHHSDLIIHTSIVDGKEFLIKSIISEQEQKHIDFIITDWKFTSQNAKELLIWIRNSEETYSSRNFQFKSIPLLLIEDAENQSSTIEEGFDGVVQGFPSDHWRLKSEINSVIKKWRYSLANDLDLMGLDPKTQKVYPGQRESFISYHRLKVLSRSFVDNRSKRLNYIWTNNDLKRLNNSNDLFASMINKTIRNPKA